jgi:dolichol-phosphate mannosyltransferase
MKFSVVIPAHNEAENLAPTVERTTRALTEAGFDYEIVVVNDNSEDDTDAVMNRLCARDSAVRLVHNQGQRGFGLAVRTGLQCFAGDAVAIVMADGSDSPEDVVTYFRRIQEGYECVFGSRFMGGSRIVDYPPHKLLLNRMANWFVKTLFRLPYNDITNAFKCYRRNVISGIGPLISKHFNLTVEMPLKSIVRGYSYTVVPISWTNRKVGMSKLKIQEMGSRYLFIVLYVWLEKLLARGDYRRDEISSSQEAGQRTHV